MISICQQAQVDPRTDQIAVAWQQSSFSVCESNLASDRSCCVTVTDMVAMLWTMRERRTAPWRSRRCRCAVVIPRCGECSSFVACRCVGLCQGKHLRPCLTSLQEAAIRASLQSAHIWAHERLLTSLLARIVICTRCNGRESSFANR